MKHHLAGLPAGWRRIAGAVLASGLVLGAVSACSAAAAVTPLPPCPATRPTQVNVLWSDSGSERSSAIATQRMVAVRYEAELAASCKATLTVTFVPSEAHTTELYSGSPRHSAGTATATARLTTRDITKKVMPAITKALQPLLQSQPPSISSPSELLQVAADQLSGSPSKTYVVILSDWVQQDTTVNLNRPLTAAMVTQLAAVPPVPSTLAGLSVSMYGVGATRDSTPAPADWIGYIDNYADLVCKRTNANCTVRTQYPSI